MPFGDNILAAYLTVKYEGVVRSIKVVSNNAVDTSADMTASVEIS